MIAQYGGNYRLIQGLRHTVYQQLKISRTVKPAKEVSNIVLRRSTSALFWYRVQKQDKKKLQAIRYKNLLWIFVNHMIVRKSPSSNIVVEGLDYVSRKHASMTENSQCLGGNRATREPPACPGR